MARAQSDLNHVVSIAEPAYRWEVEHPLREWAGAGLQAQSSQVGSGGQLGKTYVDRQWICWRREL